jgi:hypothetical protein
MQSKPKSGISYPLRGNSKFEPRRAGIAYGDVRVSVIHSMFVLRASNFSRR